MMKKLNKNIALLLCANMIGLIIIAIIPKNVDEITNAVVNPNNGDIAFSYCNYSERVDVLRVTVYSKEGERLFSKTFLLEGSYAALKFHEDILCVCEGRIENRKHCYDRNGAEVNANITIAEIRERHAFDDWKSSFGKKTYSLDGYTYIYEAPTIFKHIARLTISDAITEKVIYESTRK